MPSQWPPEDPRSYIRSESFAALLCAVVERFAERYPQLDFSDATAAVFTWFAERLQREPGFINGKRFKTESALRAYVRQAVWNAARYTARQRQQHGDLGSLDPAFELVGKDAPVDQLAMFHECRDKLPELHRLVFDAYIEWERGPTEQPGEFLARVERTLTEEHQFGGLSPQRIEQAFNEAAEFIWRCMSHEQIPG